MAELVALSPSRANDYMSCPLKFRFRAVDRIPEPPSWAAFKGTLVHSVLEDLFTFPAEGRTLDAALKLLPGSYSRLAEKSEDVATMFPTEADRDRLFDESATLLRNYFALELPDRLNPAQREQFVSAKLGNGLVIRGFIDRVDVASEGQVRLVDYKTGKQPRPQYSREAEFQMRFYALLKYKTDGVLVHTLSLFYLGSTSIKSMRPTMSDVERTESEVLGLWADITDSAVSGNWRPQKSPLCSWCSFRSMCPAWGNEAPPVPAITRIAGRPEHQDLPDSLPQESR